MPENGTPVPIACALEGDALGARWQRWRALVARAGTGVLDLPHGVQLSFAPEAEAELQILAAAERSCCGWADWTVTRGHAELTLSATANAPEGAEALRAFFR